MTASFSEMYCRPRLITISRSRDPVVDRVHDKFLFLPPRGTLPHHTKTRECTSFVTGVMVLRSQEAPLWNCALWRRLLKLCPLAQRDAPGHSFNGAPGHSFNGGLATLLHESEKIFCVKTYKIGNLTHNLEKTAKCGFRTMNLRTHASVLTTKGTKTEISSGSAYYITKLKNLRKNLRGCGLYNKTWKPSRKPSRRIIGSETRDDGQGMFGQ